MIDEATLLWIAVVAIVALFVLLFRSWLAHRKLRKRFAPILDVEAERDRLAVARDRLRAEVERQRAEWQMEFTDTIAELERISADLDQARDDAVMHSFGFYEPRYDFGSSVEYKERLESVRAQQKEMIRGKKAAVCPVEWQVEGSKAKGTQMTRRYLKLQLRAFNGECDAAVARVKYNNVLQLEKRIERAFDAINKLGATNHCEITRLFLKLKIDELALTHEYQEKRQEEKEEQRQIRQQMRDEEKAQRELEKAKREAEKDEARQQEALEKARKELAEAEGRKQEKLAKRIVELERRLQEAQANRERAVSRAQMTKSGHVYVISNIGSFGEHVYKIGMTRRLEPHDRIRELGDASVPFGFDVHAMIFSENAPELEAGLHRAFDDRRLNLVNRRKEFFNVGLAEIETIVRQERDDVQFVMTATAEQFQKTLAIRAERANAGQQQTEAVEAARSVLEARKAVWARPLDEAEIAIDSAEPRPEA